MWDLSPINIFLLFECHALMLGEVLGGLCSLFVWLSPSDVSWNIPVFWKLRPRNTQKHLAQALGIPLHSALTGATVLRPGSVITCIFLPPLPPLEWSLSAGPMSFSCPVYNRYRTNTERINEGMDKRNKLFWERNWYNLRGHHFQGD